MAVGTYQGVAGLAPRLFTLEEENREPSSPRQREVARGERPRPARQPAAPSMLQLLATAASATTTKRNVLMLVADDLRPQLNAACTPLPSRSHPDTPLAACHA